MADAFVAREVIAEREIMTAFVGHHCGFFRNIGLDDRDDIASTRSFDMKRPNLPAVAIDERQYRILVAMAATFDRAFFAADESFVRFDHAAHAAHWGKLARAHSFTDAVSQKPSTFDGDPQSAMQLVRANAFLAGADKVDSSQPIPHGDMAVLENCSDFYREWLATTIAFVKANSIAFALKRG